jgi:hypothetical protein
LILVDEYILRVSAHELAALQWVPNSTCRLHLNNAPPFIIQAQGFPSCVDAPALGEVVQPHE